MGGVMEWPRLRERNKITVVPNYYTWDVRNPVFPEHEKEEKISLTYLSGEMDRFEGSITARWYQEQLAKRLQIPLEHVQKVIDAVLCGTPGSFGYRLPTDSRPHHWSRGNLHNGDSVIKDIFDLPEHIHCFCSEQIWRSWKEERYIKEIFELCCDCLLRNVVLTEDETDKELLREASVNKRLEADNSQYRMKHGTIIDATN